MINLNVFSKQHPHGEQNRTCVKSPELLTRIDKFLASKPKDEQELMEIEKEIRYTNKCWIPKWLQLDLESPCIGIAVEKPAKKDKAPKVEQPKKAEAPKVEEPVTETPAPEKPMDEGPVPETPMQEEPATEQPMIEEPTEILERGTVLVNESIEEETPTKEEETPTKEETPAPEQPKKRGRKKTDVAAE